MREKVFLIYSVLVIISPVTFPGIRPVFADSVFQQCQTGTDHYQKNKFDEALKSFLDAQIEDPENTGITYNIANAHYKMRAYEEAEKSFLSVAAISPDRSLQEKAFYNLGNCRYRQGNLNEAVEYYKKALDLDPNDQDAKHNLEFVREEIKRRLEEEEKRQQQQEQQSSPEQSPPQSSQQQGDGKNLPQQAQDEPQHMNSDKDGDSEKNRVPAANQGPQEQDNFQKPQEQQQGQEQGQTAQARPMAEEEAERWLQSLSEDQKEALKEQIKRQVGGSSAPKKEW